MPTISATPVRPVFHVVYPQVKLLDFAGPAQVFHDARDASGERRFEALLISQTGGRIVTDTCVEVATKPFDEVTVDDEAIVIIPGGPGVVAATHDEELVSWLRDHLPRARVVASTCTGAFLLAEAGLLDGRRAVTHWDDCAELQRRYPAVRVETDPIFLQDDGVWTSAGVTAGIDLALALVEQDIGHQATVDLARRLVVYAKRPGGQSQFSRRLQQQSVDETGSFEALHAWVEQHIDEDLRIERLAEQVAMSPRNFHRVYTRATGVTPARMVARMRVEAARRALEETDLGISTIAYRCGFGTGEQMRRTFQRELGLAPSAYREAWRPAQPDPSTRSEAT